MVFIANQTSDSNIGDSGLEFMIRIHIIVVPISW
jgi:hypothetical protein